MMRSMIFLLIYIIFSIPLPDIMFICIFHLICHKIFVRNIKKSLYNYFSISTEPHANEEWAVTIFLIFLYLSNLDFVHHINSNIF